MKRRLLHIITSLSDFPTDGLVNYWRMNGDAIDQQENYDGVVTGASTVTGKLGDALSMDGVNDYVQIGLSVTSFPLTIGFWTKGFVSGQVGSSYLGVSFLSNGAPTANGSIQWGNGGGLLSANRRNLSLTAPASWSGDASTWRLVMIKSTGVLHTNTIYKVNNELGTVTNSSGSATTAAFTGNTIDIGRFNSTFYAGAIDDFFVFNRITTDDEDALIYNSGNGLIY